MIGASNVVGKPLASLLLNREATVAICHILTKDTKKEAKKAEIVIVAVGNASISFSSWYHVSYYGRC